ncbi:MAG: hypothetical protein RR034_07730 [Bacteroidales bacterium]
MKKNILLWGIAAICAITIFSCQDTQTESSSTSFRCEEDFYNPQHKISKITNLNGRNSQFEYINSWLSKIVYNNNTYALIFHNSDGTISHITLHNSTNHEVIEKHILTYQNNKIKKIEVTDNNQIIIKFEFTRANGHIASIKLYADESFISKHSEHSLLNTFFAGCNMKALRKVMAQYGKKGVDFQFEIICTYTGNNVTKTTCETDYNGYIINLETNITYDSKNNPYFGLPYPIAEMTGYCTNNSTFITTTTSVTGIVTDSVTNTLTYTYDSHHYPLTSTNTETYFDYVTNVIHTSFEYIH